MSHVPPSTNDNRGGDANASTDGDLGSSELLNMTRLIALYCDRGALVLLVLLLLCFAL